MKRFLKHNELSRYLGVSPGYVSKLRNQGRLVRDETTGKYDCQHATNAATIERVRSTKLPQTTPDTADSGNSEELAQILYERAGYKRDKERQLARRYEIQNAKDLGELIHVDLVRAYFGGISTSVRTYILPLGTRLAPHVVAAARRGAGELEICDMIEAETAVAIGRMKDAAMAVVNQVAHDMPTEEDGNGDD